MSATTTFLLTDIEGSTRLWEEHPEQMRLALQIHDGVIADAVGHHGGRVFKHTGDGVAAAFSAASPALAAARDIQRELSAADTPKIGSLRVRIGIHSGEADERDGDYFGPPLNRVSRLMSVGHGGQTLVSLVTARLAEDDGDVELVDLGEHRLRDLGHAEHIFQLKVDSTEEFPTLRTLDTRLNNLPVIPTSFVGRQVELEELTELLGHSRLVTVTGVGGSGKTRLAMQAAVEASGGYPAGFWMVMLGALTDSALLDEAVMDSLGLEQATGTEPRQALLEHIAKRQMLLILDNCEHLIAAVADLVDDILTHCPECVLISTSRELLGVSGEVAFGLRSMALPKSDVDAEALLGFDAVRLFAERAAAVDHHFSVNEVNAEAVLEICRRLDGMPLAIELAAARVRTFSPAKIAELLDQRFRLLTGGVRTALPRQQTLAAAIEWSYRLLGPEEQTLFRRLSAFQGGFTLEAVSAVCATDDVDELEILELLPILVDKSLVSTDEDAVDRFTLLETIRQFSRDLLDDSEEADEIRRRHADYYTGLVEEAEEEAFGPKAKEVREAVFAEFDNLRQTMTWALDAGDGDIALRAAFGFSRFSIFAERWSEGLRWFSRALDAASEQASQLEKAKRLVRLGALKWRSPDQTEAPALYRQALDLLKEVAKRSSDTEVLSRKAGAIFFLAVMDLYLGEGGENNENFTRDVQSALEIYEEIGDRQMVAACLGNLAHHADPRGDPDASRRQFDEAEAIFNELGDMNGLVTLGWQRANFEFHAGDLDAATESWGKAIAAAEAMGLTSMGRRYRVGLALTKLENGDRQAAVQIRAGIRDLFDDSDVRTGGTRALLQNLIVARAGADAADARWDLVALSAGASETVEQERNPVRWDLLPYFERTIAVARAELGAETYEELRRQGASMSRNEVIEFLGSEA